jgi:hypothetical protein
MKTLLFSFAAAALTACLATSAFAGPKTTLNIQTGNTTVAIKSAKPGIRVVNGRSARAVYHVRDYRAWSSYCWFPQYRCYGYYSSIDGLWFYWYAPLNRFLPVSYMVQYPPAAIGIGPVSPVAGTPGLPGAPGTPGIVPTGTGPTGSLPPGATGVPTTPPGGAVPPSGPTAPGDPMMPPPQ